MTDFPDSTRITTPTKTGERPIILIGNTAVSLLRGETPSEPIQLTTYPIEYGEGVAEYAIDLPKTLVLDCKFLSDYVGPNVNLDEFERANGGNRPTSWQDKRDAILADKRNYRIMDVFTGYDTYKDMVIVDYALNRRPETSESWTVQLFFQKANLIRPQWVSVPIERIPAERRTEKLKRGSTKGAGKTKAGERPGKELTAEQKERPKSWIAALRGRG